MDETTGARGHVPVPRWMRFVGNVLGHQQEKPRIPWTGQFCSTWRRTDSKNVPKKSHWYTLTSIKLENFMPVAARDVHETRLCDHFHVEGEIEVFKRLKQAIPIPFAAGERDRTTWEFLPYL